MSVVCMQLVRSVLPEDPEELLELIGSKALKIATTKSNKLKAEKDEAKKTAYDASTFSRWLK